MGKTGRLNLEMNDWMGNQNKKREKLTDSDILKQFEQAEKDTRFLPINPPPKDEFDQIWSRIQAEQALFSEISNTTNTKSSRKTRRRPGAGSSNYGYWRMFCGYGNEILFLPGWKKRKSGSSL